MIILIIRIVEKEVVNNESRYNSRHNYRHVIAELLRSLLCCVAAPQKNKDRGAKIKRFEFTREQHERHSKIQSGNPAAGKISFPLNPVHLLLMNRHRCPGYPRPLQV